jgi:Glycosyltransferase like family
MPMNAYEQTSGGGGDTATVPAARTNKIRLVCATRLAADAKNSSAALGRSLQFYRTFPRGQPIELRLFPNNEAALPTVYNAAIEESVDNPAILVFLHDDVYLNDFYWSQHLIEGLARFHVVGLAGNRRRVAGQASWMFLDDSFTRDDDANLSGVLGHGQGFPDLIELSFYGAPGQEVKLLDGVFLAVRSNDLVRSSVRFDPAFKFHFYDLDFCRQAESAGLKMGTWTISAIHASPGRLGVDAWRQAYVNYLVKYGEDLPRVRL